MNSVALFEMGYKNDSASNDSTSQEHQFEKQSKPIPFRFDGDDAKYSLAKS